MCHYHIIISGCADCQWRAMFQNRHNICVTHWLVIKMSGESYLPIAIIKLYSCTKITDLQWIGIYFLVALYWPSVCCPLLWRYMSVIWRPKSSTTGLLVEQLVHGYSKGNIEAPHYWPIVRESPSQSARNAGRFSMIMACINAQSRGLLPGGYLLVHPL